MLKPSSFNINLIYECPKCRSKNWFSAQEVKARTGLSCCGELFKIQPIKNIKLNCQFDSQVSSKALKILKSYGYNEKEIKAAGIVANNDEQFVKKFLATIQP